MVVVSRTVPDFPVSRLRVMGQVCDIGETDLAFTESEIEQLFSEQFHIVVNQRIVRDLHGKTGRMGDRAYPFFLPGLIQNLFPVYFRGVFVFFVGLANLNQKPREKKNA